MAVEDGDVAHAFMADSGEEMEFLSIGERNDSEAVLSTPTWASGWWPDSSARAGSTGAWRGTSKRRAASTASFYGPLDPIHRRAWNGRFPERASVANDSPNFARKPLHAYEGRYRSVNSGEGCITWMTSAMTLLGARKMKWR